MRRTARALVLTLALAVLLAGCHPPTLTKVRGWPGATPVFASEEEALAAAEEAYGEYLATSDAITADGGVNPERIEGLVTPERRVEELSSFTDFSAEGLRTTGSTSFDSVELKHYYEEAKRVVVEIYLCVDVTNVRIIDSTGVDVTPADRVSRLPLQVGFSSGSRSALLLLSRNEVLVGENYCTG
jgi:hypothetical protein